MNISINLSEWSERQQVLAIIVLGSTLLFVLSFFLLLPQIRKNEALKADIKKIESQLSARNFMRDEATLQKILKEEERHLAELLQDWNTLADRMTTLTDWQDIAETRVDVIDYKVALYSVQQRLNRKALTMNIKLPPDLGMNAEIAGSEDARRRMLQLRSVEKLVDMILNLKIASVRIIEPLPQVQHPAPGTTDIYLEEYPVRLLFRGNRENLYAMLHGILESQNTFFLRSIRIEPLGPPFEELEAHAVLSCLLFTKDVKELAKPAAPTKPKATGPLGH
jgi:DNA-binding transcriptional MerR regulator